MVLRQTISFSHICHDNLIIMERKKVSFLLLEPNDIIQTLFVKFTGLQTLLHCFVGIVLWDTFAYWWADTMLQPIATTWSWTHHMSSGFEFNPPSVCLWSEKPRDGGNLQTDSWLSNIAKWEIAQKHSVTTQLYSICPQHFTFVHKNIYLKFNPLHAWDKKTFYYKT